MGEHDILITTISRLEQIAKAHNTEFRYTVTISPDAQGIVYFFTCTVAGVTERVFVDGSGLTINDAIQAAAANIEDAAADWDY